MIRLYLIAFLSVFYELGAGALPSEPNLIDQAKTMRQILEQEEIQTLPADSNESENELPVLDALIEELSCLEITVKAEKSSQRQPGSESFNATALEVKPRSAEPESMETESDVPEISGDIVLIPEISEEVPKPAVSNEKLSVSVAPPSRPAATKQKVDTLPADTLDSSQPSKTFENLGYVNNPLELADALYQSGQYIQAARFYQQFTETNEDPKSSDYQWALYQYAICRAETDPMDASRLFQKLVASCPNSPWTTAAQVRMVTLTWAQNKKIQELKGVVIDPNGF